MKKLTEHEFQTMALMNCTKAEIAKKVMGTEAAKIDYALPQPWLDSQPDYEFARNRFVWYYADGDIFGQPFSLVEIGE